MKHKAKMMLQIEVKPAFDVPVKIVDNKK